MNERRLRITAIVLMVAWLFTASAMAQPADPPDTPETIPPEGMHVEAEAGEVSRMTSEVSNEVFSPFCPGKTLAMCPSPNAAEVRRDIQEMAKEGLSKDAIKERLIAEYGEEFRIVEPPATDNIALLAAVGVGLGLAVLAVVMISRRSRPREGDVTRSSSEESAAAGSPPGDDIDEADPYLQELRDSYRD